MSVLVKDYQYGPCDFISIELSEVSSGWSVIYENEKVIIAKDDLQFIFRLFDRLEYVYAPKWSLLLDTRTLEKLEKVCHLKIILRHDTQCCGCTDPELVIFDYDLYLQGNKILLVIGDVLQGYIKADRTVYYVT